MIRTTNIVNANTFCWGIGVRRSSIFRRHRIWSGHGWSVAFSLDAHQTKRNESEKIGDNILGLTDSSKNSNLEEE